MIATRIAPNSFSAGALARPSRSPRPPSWFKGDPTSKGKGRETRGRESSACFGKTTPYGEIFKVMLRKFSPPHRLTLLCSNFVKFVRLGNRYNHALFTWKNNKISPASQTVATARTAPKIYQKCTTMYSVCTVCWRFHPNRFTFGGVIAKIVNTAKLPRRVNSLFAQSIASKRIITSATASLTTTCGVHTPQLKTITSQLVPRSIRSAV